MPTARVTAVMLDGTKHEGTGIYLALADRVTFERAYGHSVLGDLQNLKEEEAAWFCWRTLERIGISVGTFDEFVQGVEALEVEVLDAPEDPTREARPPGT